MANASRIGFATKMGGAFAAAGSAIGLGNIWRFPMQAGQNGGSAFLLVYLVCILLFGIPLLVAEFAVGRHARANVADAYEILAPGSRWKWVGPLAVLIAFLILCYYNVVAGWVLNYTFDAVVGNFRVDSVTAADGTNVFAAHFLSFISNPWQPVVCLVLFMLCTHFVVTRGVQRGIERVSSLLMPLLFVIMILLVVFALTMPGASRGLNFLFTFDLSAINSQVILSAIAQCFYSLSLGMGIVTYASYFRREANLTRTAMSVAVMDTLVAVVAGIIIFPAVFSVEGMEPAEGASLVFIALPNVFNNALGGSTVLGWLVPVLFYALLCIAAVTSCIFLHEVSTAFLSERTGWSRNKAATWVTGLCILLGVACSLSMGPWEQLTVCGMNLFDLFDYVTAKLMLPISGMFVALFVGWKLSIHKLWVELTSHGKIRFPWLQPFLFLLRYLIPATIAVIMLAQLGLIPALRV